METKTLGLIPILIITHSFIIFPPVSASPGLLPGYYSFTCPLAEHIVKETVESHFKINNTVAPKLLRMHFHDCFVEGCDASNLIDGPSSEKTAGPNRALTGYEVIQDAKTQLEKLCPLTVSCADILALAARDAVVLTNGTYWEVPTGRRDGVVSLASKLSDLPTFRDSAQVQKKKFAAKGLTAPDMVTLLGAHTIGTAGCKSMSYRLYNYTGAGTGTDPSLDKTFLPQIQTSCPISGNGLNRVELDTGSSNQFDTSFYENLKRGRGVLESDQNVWADEFMGGLMKGFLRNGGVYKFNDEFGRAMVKMSMVGVKTGIHGEIRKVCSAIN